MDTYAKKLSRSVRGINDLEKASLQDATRLY